jgi:two-component system, NarL family, response regulator DegU
MTITIINNSSILRDVLYSTINHVFPNINAKILDTGSSLDFENHIHTTDLFIIDIDVKKDFSRLIKKYKSVHKKIILLTSKRHKETLIPYFKLNLDGYFYKEIEKEEIIKAMNMIMNGEQYIHPKLAPILFNEYFQFVHVKNRPLALLTEREWEVLELLTKGYKNREIARELYLTEETVKNHVTSILRKLNVNDRTNAVIKAIQNRWVTLDA